eukprot:TRINITY_DN121410_c0_g1_i1.p1 TRINITY_DN121410_c0_g1~~TRINITY_DN121410_c0_g1_i1.p1  ORF type:complete len:553 (+),score=105.89 TRINITY_DN121410_c0_g1_i1:118-1659(+)
MARVPALRSLETLRLLLLSLLFVAEKVAGTGLPQPTAFDLNVPVPAAPQPTGNVGEQLPVDGVEALPLETRVGRLEALLRQKVEVVQAQQKALLALESQEERFEKRQAALTNKSVALNRLESRALRAFHGIAMPGDGADDDSEAEEMFESVLGKEVDFKAPRVDIDTVEPIEGVPGGFLLVSGFGLVAIWAVWRNQCVKRGKMGSSQPLTPGRSSSAAGALTPEDYARVAHSNRDFFEENQRAAALKLLVRSMPAFCGVVLLVALVGGTSLTFYFWGWKIWITQGHKSCDTPLADWLFWLLWVPVLSIAVNYTIDSCLGGYDPSDDEAHEWAVNVRRSALAATNFLWIALFVYGGWLFFTAKSCDETNPGLYEYVEFYLLWGSVLWVAQFWLQFGLTKFVLWIRSIGILETTHESHVVARPGLCAEVEDVAFSADMFAFQPPQCCICEHDFRNTEKSGPGATIKRTPCNHFFHTKCLERWLCDFSKTCPICKFDLEAQPRAAQPPEEGGEAGP